MKVLNFASVEQRDFAVREIMALDPAKAWTCTVKLLRPRRSLNQNALFHQHLHIIADATGNDFDDVKNALKDLFLPLKVVKVGKVERMVRPETSSLETGEMSVFIDKVIAFAATDLGISLPIPGEYE